MVVILEASGRPLGIRHLRFRKPFLGGGGPETGLFGPSGDDDVEGRAWVFGARWLLGTWVGIHLETRDGNRGAEEGSCETMERMDRVSLAPGGRCVRSIVPSVLGRG